MAGESKRYNGWTNYETWNVALWIGNDEGLYGFARSCRPRTYETFVEQIKEFGGEIALQTPDGVAWNDSGLDIEELDSMMEEL